MRDELVPKLKTDPLGIPDKTGTGSEAARVCSNAGDFNNRNLFLTAKLLKQGYRCHKIRKAFSKFYHRHSELIVKYKIGLKTLLQQGISEPIFYGDLVYKFKRIVGNPNFSDQLKKITKRYMKAGYNLEVMRQSDALKEWKINIL